MADNITLPGTGAIVGTETVSGAQVQQVKVLWGSVDTGTEIASGTPLPVVQTGTPVLPTGASTSAAQTTGNASVASIDTKIPALGQALAAASVPVVMTAAQVTALTPPVAITGFALDATLTGGTQKSKIVDSGGTNVATVSSGGALKVDGSAVTQPVSVSGTVSVNSLPATSGGLSTYKNINLLATGINIKSSAGQLYGYYISNRSTAERFVKVYNTSGAPTVGTDVPFMTLPLAAGAAANVSFGGGISFGTGIGIAATTGIADNDTAAPSANDVVVNIFYK